MKITKNIKIVIISGLAAAIALLYVQFVIIKSNKELKNLSIEYTQKVEKMTLLNELDEIVPGMDQEIDTFKEMNDLLISKIAKPLRIPVLIGEVDQIAEQHDVAFLDISFSGENAIIKGGESNNDSMRDIIEPTNEKLTLKSIGITVRFSGDFQNCIDFIEAFEKHERMYKVKDAIINISGATCTGEIAFTSYSIY